MACKKTPLKAQGVKRCPKSSAERLLLPLDPSGKSVRINLYTLSVNSNKSSAFLDCNIEHLCKSIIVENTAYAKKSINHAYGGRYLCIIVQYQEKLDAEQLSRFVCALVAKETGIAVARKYFSFQRAPKDVCAERTGFEHNGVSPFGSKQFFPVNMYYLIIGTCILKRCKR